MMPIVMVGLLVGKYDPLQTMPTPSSKHFQSSTDVPMSFPAYNYRGLMQQHLSVGDDFASYYRQHSGTLWLGEPLTTELPTAAGLTQYFSGGVLTTPIAVNVRNENTITVLPVVSYLLSAAAGIPIGQPVSSLTYADLQQSQIRPTVPFDRSAYWWLQSPLDPAISGIYFTAKNSLSHHYIPAIFAAYLLQFPDWQNIVGEPLTDALPAKAWVGEQEHHLAIQAFTNTILRVDLTGTGALHADIQPVGLDYLDLFNVPSIVPTKITSAWTNALNVPIETGPATSATTAILGLGFPVKLLPESVWSNGQVWYHVQWTTLAARREGWVAGIHLTFTAPKDTSLQRASLEALSSRFVTLLPSLGDRLAVSVSVPELNRTFTNNGSVPIVMASTFKIPIMLTVFYQAEQTHQPLSAEQYVLLQTMIEESDNEAATILYSQIGFDTGILQFLQAAGFDSIHINTVSFGFSTGTSDLMVHLLTGLQQGTILTASDRAMAIDLMSHVTPEQRQGIGVTAPSGATYSMKDGWLQDGDGWVTASVGMLMYQNHSYVIAIYLRRSATLDEGWQIVNTICATIDSSLFS